MALVGALVASAPTTGAHDRVQVRLGHGRVKVARENCVRTLSFAHEPQQQQQVLTLTDENCDQRPLPDDAATVARDTRSGDITAMNVSRLRIQRIDRLPPSLRAM